MGKKTTGKSSKAQKSAALKDLISKGKEQGYLSYDEINDVLPDDALSPEQLDETLMMFNELDIDIVDAKNKKIIQEAKKTPKKAKADTSVADFGSITDPVKMYLREMGMVTLLSREEEVEIAKKIEAGEQEVLRALMDTTTGVDCLLELGDSIEAGKLRPRHVLRDLDDNFMALLLLASLLLNVFFLVATGSPIANLEKCQTESSVFRQWQHY